ncbi:MAG: hypothetical protein KDI30_00545 [Pseudomonadales bacterium]|nr:hypothetical protein [Pseudomonadales bacterium]
MFKKLFGGGDTLKDTQAEKQGENTTSGNHVPLVNLDDLANLTVDRSHNYPTHLDQPIIDDLQSGNLSSAIEKLSMPFTATTLRRSVHPKDLSPLWHHFKAHPDQCKALVDFIAAKHPEPLKVISEDTVTYLLLLELKLIQGDYPFVIQNGGLFSQKHSKDLRLQDIRARAWMLQNNKTDINEDLKNGFAPFRKMWCRDPFEKFTATEFGLVNLCCTNWMNASVGSFYQDEFEDVWGSPMAQDIRRSILDGSYQYCNKMACPFLRNQKLPDIDVVPHPYSREVIDGEYLTLPHVYPRNIVLSEDPICNLTCPSCRDEQKKGDENKLVHFEEKIFPKLLEGFTADMRICGHGDPFASQHYMRLMKRLDPKVHKIQNLTILTNGVLFSEKTWNNLSNLHDYNILMSVSIDAATEKTYDIVRRGGNWGRLQKALAFMQELRNTGRIMRFNFNYVVQNDNFREMPAFVEMAKSYDVDNVWFAFYQKAGSHISNDLYKEQAVYLPGHPNHAEFKEILAMDIMKDPIAHVPGV